MGYSFTRLWEAALSVALRNKDQYWLCSIRGMVRLLVFAILLWPLFALYMFGQFVSPWISLWRLCRTITVRHGYMSGEKANLKPALLVLYSLALLQGVLFYYWAISASVEKKLVQQVAEAYEIDEEDKARESVLDYLRMIREGCEKDLSFARGRNLITYALDLMASNSQDNYLSAARILDTLIRQLKPTGEKAAHPIYLAAISRYTRYMAMRIVAHFASEIRLDRIMYGIRNICSLLEHKGSSDSDPHKVPATDSEKYQVFLMYSTGISILSELAKDEENFKHMSNTDGITSRIVTVIVECNKLHDEEHEDWLSIARPGIQLINRLAGSKSFNVQQLSEFLGDKNETTTLQKMLDCQKCNGDYEVQRSLIKALTQIISIRSQQNLSSKNKEKNKKLIESFIKSLLIKFLHGSDRNFRKMAGESLAQLSLTSPNSCKLILSAQVGIVDALVTLLLKDKNKQYRKNAADILEHLCRHYYFDNNLRDAMIRVIHKVLNEVLKGGESDNRRSTNYVELHGALASLCDTVNMKLISADLVSDFDKKAVEICEERELPEMNFGELVREAKEIVGEHRKRLEDWAFSSSDDDDDCCIM